MRVTCINDSNKPSDFPSAKWIKKGEEYTLGVISRMNMMGGQLGCTLVEIDTSGCFPYTHFLLSRFEPLNEVEIEELELELVND